MATSAGLALCFATKTIPSFPEPNVSASSSACRAAYRRALGISISFMIAEQTYGAHSAQVEMRLIVNGDAISITQMGADFLITESAGDHSPGDAIFVLQVDQSERRWNVRLPNGISAGSKRVAIAVNA